MIMIIALMIKPARLFWMDDLSECKMNDSSWWHATLVSLSVILPMSTIGHSRLYCYMLIGMRGGGVMMELSGTRPPSRVRGGQISAAFAACGSARP